MRVKAYTLKFLSVNISTLPVALCFGFSVANAQAIMPAASKDTLYKKGLVVCATPNASAIGLEILKKGGNAIDAAVAVHFALEVSHPEAGNIGGGGLMVYRAAEGKINTLDFREKAPASAYTNMFLDSLGNVIPNLSIASRKASGVPGSVDGMYTAYKKYGKLKWKDLVQPAVDLARNGFKVTKRLAFDLNRASAQFIKLNGDSTYLQKKGNWAEGDLLVQEDLAKTLEFIRDKGREGFYAGPVAKLIVAEMQKGSGNITAADLENYHSVWRKAITGDYKEYHIIAMPPPSSGGIALLQLLQSVKKFPLRRWGHNQDSTMRVIIEAERRVYADRSKYLGDPDFYKVPVDSLLNPGYNEGRMKNFSWDAATPSSSILPGTIPGYESDQTTHYSIVDNEGNAVSITTTLNDSFGSKVFVKGSGFLLNDEMDDFSIKPGTPNMFGLIGGKANSIEPGKRMLSSMTPTIVEKAGKLFMVVGTPGGATIITSVFQTILNVIEFDMDMQQAVDAKKFHHQWLPDEVAVEKEGITASTKSILTAKGYKIVERGAIGRVDAILVTKDGYYQGGADPRGDDTKAGW